MRRNIRGLQIVLLALCILPAAAFAAGTPLKPADALLPWTAESQYLVGHVENVPELAKTVLSWSALSGDASEELGLEEARAIIDQLPFVSVAAGGGIGKGVLHAHIAATVKESFQPMLGRMVTGTLTSDDKGTFGAFGIQLEGPFSPRENVSVYRVQGLSFGPIGFYVGAKENLLLMGFTADEVLACMDALADPAKRINVPRAFREPNFFLFNDNGLLQMGLLAGGVPVLLRDVVHFEAAFGMKGDDWSAGISTNLAKAMFSAEDLAKFAPVKTQPLLIGGGSVVSVMHTPLVFDQFRRSLLQYGGEEGADAYKEITEGIRQFGLEEDDLRNLLTGTVTAVIGGTANYAGTAGPGAYVVLNGQGDAAKKVYDALTGVVSGLGAPMEQPKVEGWDSVTALDMMGTLTFAVKGPTLLLGVLDAKQLASPAKPSQELATLLARNDLYGWIFLDNQELLKELLNVVKNREHWRQFMGSDTDDVMKGIFTIRDAVARMRSFRLEASGLDTVRMIVGMVVPGGDVEKAWMEAASAWKTDVEMRRKALENAKEAPKDLQKNPKKDEKKSN
jgi:hypothetical protein